MKKQITFSALVLLSIVASAQESEYTISCNKPLLFPQQTLSTNAKELNITADHGEIVDKNQHLLTGNASLISDKYYILADKIKIDKLQKKSSANGNVKFQNKQIMLTGDSAVLDKKGSVFTNAKYHYPKSKITGQADKIVDDGNKQTFDSMSYSLCPLGNTDWQMKADKVTLDQQANLGIAKNVTVEFMGVPIFYSPYYEWTLKGKSSGFLAPSASSYTESGKDKGYQVRIPYYFNISADRDFLLTLNQLSTRGSSIEGKYRQLFDKGRIEIEGHYLDKDKINKQKRWLFDSKLDLSLNDKTTLNINSHRVSDDNYFKEIAHYDTGKTSLTSSANITYKNKQTNLTALIVAENEQLLSTDKNEASYTRAPEIIISKKVQGLGNREAVFSISSTKFKHLNDAKKSGTRTNLQADFERNIKTAAYSIKPKLSFKKTHYSMENNSSQERNIYSFGVDSKLNFERETNLFGKNLVQTLTPRLAYNYTPGKEQSGLTNFDSAKVSELYANLFAGKSFTGLDRISKTNDVVIGLESDFIDQKTGKTYLALKIAQARHLDNTTTAENGSITAQKDYSNIAIGADLSLGDFTFKNAIQYDQDDGKTQRSNSEITYISGAKKFISATHENDAGKRTIGVYGALPINKKIHIFGSANRSLSNLITNKKTLGFAYESCCWKLRLAQFNEYTGAGNYDKVSKIEFVLKGLTSGDSSLSKRLNEEIPNYLPNLKN
ncbi:MAG: LPS-assembly protein LptD [Candidatus Thioglobus sp.]|nr:MAG: LPS-assembly protein LptD [Candidatus Thioglobus sp.]